jgi:serine/threonine-protein kinase HipA
MSKETTARSTSAPSPIRDSRHLDVLLNDKHVGIIERTDAGTQRLIYDDVWHNNPRAIPLSRSLPTTKKRHDTTTTANFMWGLLPDNRVTLDRWAAEYKVSATNPFGLLAAVGEDCPGAVQLVRPDVDLATREGVSWITEDDLAERIKELRADPGATRRAKDKGRVSLAGAQAKTALYRTAERWGIPNGRTPTTHILKPEPGGYPGFALNEHFTLLLLREIGLPSPDSEAIVSGGVPVLITKRYDRFIAKNGLVTRVHQEDMCQAMGIPPSRKYQSDGGPGIPEIMDILRHSDDPATDRDRFMRAQAFNFVVGNGDAHARNYSILYRAGGAFRLAPFYDVACLMIYAQDVDAMELAMTIGGERHIARIGPKHWQKSAKLSGFDEDRALAHVRDLIARIPGMALSVRRTCAAEQFGLHPSKQLGLGTIDRIIDAVWQRVRHISMQFGSEPMQ